MTSRYHLTTLFLLALLGCVAAADAQVQPQLAQRYFEEARMLPQKDADLRQQIMRHGLFHRIQPELGLIAEDGFNEHLDTLEGRVWMQLEWRALRRAVEASGSDRAEAIADALAFRGERRRLFPGAADNERRDEIGTVFFRNFTLSAQWGRLTADGGVLRAADGATLSVPVTGPLEGTTLRGDGWSVALNAGWVVQPSTRPGSFTIVREK